MASVATKLTVDEFLALPEKPGVKRELINGEIWEEEIPVMGGAREGHELVKSQLMMYLAGYALQKPGWRIMAETAYRFSDEQTAIPDVSILRDHKTDFSNPSIIRQPPLIAMEVVSSDLAPRLQAKLLLYLNNGVTEVWILYPDSKVI